MLEILTYICDGKGKEGDIGQDLQHPLDPFAAGIALAARFLFEKVQKIARHIDHAGVLVHHDHAA